MRLVTRDIIVSWQTRSQVLMVGKQTYHAFELLTFNSHGGKSFKKYYQCLKVRNESCLFYPLVSTQKRGFQRQDGANWRLFLFLSYSIGKYFSCCIEQLNLKGRHIAENQIVVCFIWCIFCPHALCNVYGLLYILHATI